MKSRKRKYSWLSSSTPESSPKATHDSSSQSQTVSSISSTLPMRPIRGSPPPKYPRLLNDRMRSQFNVSAIVSDLLTDLNSEENNLDRGELSPLHTRRRSQGDGYVIPPPDFAMFEYELQCPKLASYICTDFNGSIGLGDLDKLQCEIERMLLHTIDHEKKICGELLYQESGEYPSGDIANRPMPICEFRTTFPAIAGCSKDEDPAVEDPIREIDHIDIGEDLESWPPMNLPQKFWSFVKEYLDPIDEKYIRQWWHNIFEPFYLQYSERKKQEKTSDDTSANETPKEFLKSTKTGKERTSSQMVIRRREKRFRRKLSYDSPAVTGSPSKVKRSLSINVNPEVQIFADDIVKDSDRGDIATDRRVKKNGVVRPNIELENNPENDELTNGNEKSNDVKELKSETRLVDSLKVHQLPVDSAQDNSLSSQSSTVMADRLKQSLSDYLSQINFLSGNVDTVSEHVQSSLNIEEIIQDELKKPESRKDEVSCVLHRLQQEMSLKLGGWYEKVKKIWHRLLAEYVRCKLEAKLDNADKKLFEMYDKYYCDYPRRRPMNRHEREECLSALQRRNDIARAYYNQKYLDLLNCLSISRQNSDQKF